MADYQGKNAICPPYGDKKSVIIGILFFGCIYMLYIFVKINVMIDKKTASRLYAMNQMGMGNGDPGKRQARREARQARRGGGGSDDAVQVCTKETAKEGKCGAYAGGGSSTGNVQKAKNKKPTAGGEKNKVLNPRQAERRARKFEKARANAPARPMTANERKKLMGPPTPKELIKKK